MASSLPTPRTATTSIHLHSHSPNPNKRRKPPHLSFSTNRSDVDPNELRDLLVSSGHSCHRFPSLAPDGRPLPVDLGKLRLALDHSSVIVSAFCRSKSLYREASVFAFDDLLERAIPVPATERRLVGFGRAVSDGGLTASIHDVVVIPSLQRMGIGCKIVQNLTRLLTNKEIYDISALCSETERLFFKACGFGNDSLGSTTMIYTRSTSPNSEVGKPFQQTGRMLLLVPPPPSPGAYPSKRPASEIVDSVDHRIVT